MHRIPLKRASLVGALFFYGLAVHANNDCGPHLEPDWQTVRHVHDGDSLKLSDGRKIRLIGINAPELGRDNRPAEPYARAARETLLRHMHDNGNRVGLVYGSQRKDRYGRTLAHVFLADGTNINRQLLRDGLGSHIAISPNFNYAECYRQAQDTARNNRRNIWQADDGPVKDLQRIKQLPRGFQHIRGTVSRIGKSDAYMWLNFGRKLAIQIARDDLENFTDLPLESLQGKTIETSGWVYMVKNQPRMRIYHPIVIRIND